MENVHVFYIISICKYSENLRSIKNTGNNLTMNQMFDSVNTTYESQILLSSWNEQQPRTVRLVMGACSSKYSEWNIDEKWSSQEWKSGQMSNTSTGRPVYDKFVIDDDTDSDTATESNLSLKSRSLLHWVNNRLRKILDQSSKDATKDSDKHTAIWGMFMSSTLQASVFMEKNYSDNLHSIKNTEELTIKQMFDISEKLISEQSDEIYGVNTINWENFPWKQSSLVNDEEVISLSNAKVNVFSDSVLCLGKMNQNPTSNTAWEEKLIWFKDSSQYRTLDTIDGEPMEFEWNIFPGCTTLQICNKVQEFLSKWAIHLNSKDELSSCRCSMTSYGEFKTMNGNPMLTPTSFLFMQEDSHQEDGHSSDMDQKRSGILLMLTDHKENVKESLN